MSQDPTPNPYGSDDSDQTRLGSQNPADPTPQRSAQDPAASGYGQDAPGSQPYGSQQYGSQQYGAQQYGSQQPGSQAYGASSTGASAYDPSGSSQPAGTSQPYGSQPSASSYGNQPSAGGYGAQPSASSYGNQSSASSYGSQPSAGGYGGAAQAGGTDSSGSAYGAQNAYGAQQAYGQQAYDQQGYGQQGPAAGQQYAGSYGESSQQWGNDPYASAATNQQSDGLFSALFDLSFTKFITPSVVKILYILLLVLGGLTWLISMVTSFSQSALAGFGTLIFGALGLLVWLLLMRVTLEFYVAMVRTAQNSRDIKQLLGARDTDEATSTDAQSPGGASTI